MNDFRYLPQAVTPELTGLIRSACEAVMRDRAPNQPIMRNGSAYINRWMLARKAVVPIYDDPAKQLGFSGWMHSELENVYLHEYARSDADDPHCHPWSNATLVVRGKYCEAMYEAGTNKLISTEWRSAGDVVLRSAESVHAIVYTSKDCLSLFATLRKEKAWFFHTKDGPVHSSEYHNNHVPPQGAVQP